MSEPQTQGQAETPSPVASSAVLADGLLKYINETPEMLSLLYDLDLMPEQLDRESHDWFRMLILASWHRTKSEQSAND